MFIDSLSLQRVKTFADEEVPFIHPDTVFAPERGVANGRVPKPRLPNVNLLLGDNGSGKSTVLRMIALSAFGPVATQAGLLEPGLIRRSNGAAGLKAAKVVGSFTLHDAEGLRGPRVKSEARVTRRGELDILQYRGGKSALWEPAYSSENDSFFVAGYGATRRVELPEHFDMGARTRVRFLRAQRVASLFEDSYSLVPLTYWLPKLQESGDPRFGEVVGLMEQLLGPGHYRFSGRREARDYLFEKGKLRIPFRSLSDGYRAFLGWVGDLLFHLQAACPAGKRLADVRGIVLVDEIDLHLHPKWQMVVIDTIARALPRMQFILTSHSPLVVGSLEWMNIVRLQFDERTNRTKAVRLPEAVHGLDADQVLLSPFFGLPSTMAPTKRDKLERLTDRIRQGDKDAPLQLIRELSRGSEGAE